MLPNGPVVIMDVRPSHSSQQVVFLLLLTYPYYYLLHHCLYFQFTVNMVANVATFQDLLIHFSFSQEARTAIIANGLTTNQDLIGLKYKDIDNIMKIVHASRTPPMIVPYIAQKKLTTLAYWVNR